MPISVTWLNAEQTILLWLAEGEITQAEKDAAEIQLVQLQQSVPHNTGIIRDERQSTTIRENTLGITQLAKVTGMLLPDDEQPAPMPLAVYVVEPEHVEMFNQTFSRLFEQFKDAFPDVNINIMSNLLNRMKATATIDEAVAWINEMLANSNSE